MIPTIKTASVSVPVYPGYGQSEPKTECNHSWDEWPGSDGQVEMCRWCGLLEEKPIAPKQTTQRAWCGLCGTYGYVGKIFPCDKGKGAVNPCGLMGAELETVEVQSDPGDETDAPYHTDMMVPPESLDEWLEENPLPVEKDGVAKSIDIKAEITEEALRIVNGARRGAYGTPERNFDRIAEFWNAYLRQRHPFLKDYGLEYLIEARDVPAFMRFVKEARLIETPDHRDSFTDLIGYALCQAEISGAK